MKILSAIIPVIFAAILGATVLTALHYFWFFRHDLGTGLSGLIGTAIGAVSLILGFAITLKFE